jgi:hypothetical protein
MNIDQVVRIVDMRGCMAEVRAGVRVGTIIGFVRRVPYPGPTEYEYARIRMDDGSTEERVTEPRLWVKHDGLLEYRE